MPDSDEFLDMLKCPETGQALDQLPGDDLAELNATIRDGSLENDSGEPVERVLDQGLLRDDGAVVYPVRDGVPNLLVGDRIPVEDR